VSKKTWIIFGSVCIAILAGLVFYSTLNRLDVSTVDGNAVLAASDESGGIADQVYGKADSKVVFIEYGDYQCPGCGAAYQPVKNVMERYKDTVAFVFREFPLTSIHPNARAASAAAEAAGLQGKYWEMHDLLYENRAGWSELNTSERLTTFSDYATSAGLDVPRFTTDLTSEAISKKITFDTALGKKAGVSGTPTFYVNGKDISSDIKNPNGGIDEAKLSDAFDAALKEKGIAPPTKE
jgi:protein-disulfide isomerase